MKRFFDDFDWEYGGGAALTLFALALGILGPVLAVVYSNALLLALWIPAILSFSVAVGKGWF